MMHTQWSPNNLGILVPPKPPKRKRSHPVGIDLFCGCGGMSLGFMSAGFEIVAGADYDVNAMTTYLYNLGAYPVNMVFVDQEDGDRAEKELQKEYERSGFMRKGEWTGKWSGDHGLGPLMSGGNRKVLHSLPGDIPGVSNFFLGDIGKLTGERILRECGLEVGEVDVVMGGPPCQGFSSAGKQNIMDPRNSLVFEFVRLVLEIRPKMMLFENVPAILDMVTPEGLPVVDAMCRVLEDGDFGAFDALKRSLLSTSGMGAGLKGRKVSKSGKVPSPPAKSKAAGPAQMDLFGGAT